MRGNLGCPCASCKGAGSIHLDLKGILEAMEILLNCEMEVTSGYRCPAHNLEVGGKAKSKHLGDPGKGEVEQLEEKLAWACDFWPKQPADSLPKHLLWYRKAHTFHALVKPWFSYSYINRSEDDRRRWSVHGQLA